MCVHVCACVSILLLITMVAVNCKLGRQGMCHSISLEKVEYKGTITMYKHPSGLKVTSMRVSRVVFLGL